MKELLSNRLCSSRSKDLIQILISLEFLSEKYYSISPHAYCADNPARYVDPTGMIIEDPDELVKNQKDQLNQNLSYIQNALKSAELSEGMATALNKLAEGFQSSLNEISWRFLSMLTHHSCLCLPTIPA